MKTRTKIILDDWIARLVVLLLNISARILGQLLRIDHRFKKNPRRIVVCKFIGMGSIIQATPLLLSLRKSFPDAEITFLTSAGNHVLLSSIPAINNILTIDDKKISSVIGDTIKVLIDLWKRKADFYIDLETYSYYSTVVATLSCAVNRFGFYRLERNIRMGVYTHMMFYNTRAAISESYLQMARLIGCDQLHNELYHFEIDPSAKASLQSKLPKLTASSYIVINPNASDLRLERRWPAAKYVQLFEELNASLIGYQFVLIGGKEEVEYVKQIENAISAEAKINILNTSGQLSLPELFALINSATLVITNDTGPMHISFSLERPTIALFGPASPNQYGQSKHVFGIYKNVYCSPCVHDFITPPCFGDNQCMKQISVKEVATLTQKVIQSNHVAGAVESSDMHFFKEDGSVAMGIIERNK